MSEILGLFVSAFLAATLLPLSSEAVLLALLWQGEIPWPHLWGAATLGNVLGSCLNGVLGRYCQDWSIQRGFVTQQRLEQAQEWFTRHGRWSLLLAWLPVVGDPLTFVAGMLRTPWPWFLSLVFLGKGGRYLFLILALP
ncbi:MAG: DedA family protein [Magnetococcales bacterium]|nr:DedA family protein [Magnetococcales bacterium]NGZ26657.1 DedA family protein [Magnetococcales bacterium]